LTYAGCELPLEILTMETPKLRLVIAVGAAEQLDVERAPAFRRIVLRQHGGANEVIGYRRLMVADLGRETKNVGGAVFRNVSDDVDAAFMRRLHHKEPVLGMLVDLIDVNQLVMHMAHQHQIGDLIANEGRTNSVATRAGRGFGND